jgi:hypothetical protein
MSIILRGPWIKTQKTTPYRKPGEVQMNNRDQLLKQSLSIPDRLMRGELTLHQALEESTTISGKLATLRRQAKEEDVETLAERLVIL